MMPRQHPLATAGVRQHTQDEAASCSLPPMLRTAASIRFSSTIFALLSSLRVTAQPGGQSRRGR